MRGCCRQSGRRQSESARRRALDDGALQHPGRASGIFALVYGLSRIFAECFREPDAFLGYFGGFLTMGMILSLPLCAVGVWLLLRSRHEPA